MDDQPVVVLTDADRALMKLRRDLAALPIETRVADVCPYCGQHALDEQARLQFFLKGGQATCPHHGTVMTYEVKR